jgi:hypothetical protein
LRQETGAGKALAPKPQGADFRYCQNQEARFAQSFGAQLAQKEAGFEGEVEWLMT